MLLDTALDCLQKVLNCGHAAGDEFAQRSNARRELSLHRLEDRIVFSAELQSLIPIDGGGFSGSSDSPDNSVAIVEPDAAISADADFPPQAALAAATESTLAFPGAAGFGAHAQGGRGGDVYHVTNLSDDGPGSLRYGVNTMTGPRTIVFDVSGNIELESRLTVSQPHLTIAGQTAPGDGITIANHTFQIENTHDIIVRYLRIRAGDEDIANSAAATHDSFAIRWSENVIADHVSASWGIDETVATAWSDNVTIQWSIISESLSDSYHPKGPHGLALLSYGGSLSLHHNLYAHHDFRMPHVKDIKADVVNNIFYDWSKSYPSSVGSRVEGPLSSVNFENNIYVAGPSLVPQRPANLVFRGLDASEVWVSGNILDATINGTLDFESADFSLSTSNQAVFADSRFGFPDVPLHDPLMAYRFVLDEAGASLTRDVVDTRIIQEVTNQTGSVINSQSEVGGFPSLVSLPAPLDTDQDGMPDEWENLFEFLDPLDPEDRNGDLDGDGYTNLEEYLNGIVQPGLSLVAARSQVAEGKVFQLAVSGGNGAAGDGEIYQYRIDWNGDSQVDQTVNAPLDTYIEHVFHEAGDYRIGIEVTSPDGQTTHFVHEVHVATLAQGPTGNGVHNPQEDIFLPPEILVGEAAPLTLGVSGSGGESKTYEIDWNGDARSDQTVDVPPGTIVEHFYHEPGNYRVHVRTVDSRGEVVAYEKTIRVTAPVFHLSFSGPSMTELDSQESFDVNATNPFQNGQLGIEIDWDGDSQIDETAAGLPQTLTQAFQTTGPKVISIFLVYNGTRVESVEHEVFVVAPPAEAAIAETAYFGQHDFYFIRRFLPNDTQQDDEDVISGK